MKLLGRIEISLYSICPAESIRIYYSQL